MSCVHTMDEDSILERKYSLEFHSETITRLHSLLIMCAEQCKNNQKKKITLTRYVNIGHSLLFILGCSLRRFSKSNTILNSTTVNTTVLIKLRETLTSYLTNPYVDTCNRHASAGCLDAGYEVLYPTSLERVAMVANVFEEYRDENSFDTSDGRHMMMILALHRLRRTGGVASMLPKPSAVLSTSDLADQILPIQTWLSMLRQQNSVATGDRGQRSNSKDHYLIGAAKKMIGTHLTKERNPKYRKQVIRYPNGFVGRRESVLKWSLYIYI